MTAPDDPEDTGAFGYVTREGPTPKLVVVAIVWAAFGVFGLFTAMLMHSSGFAVFGVLCIVAGIGLYFAQRTRDQLVYDELHLNNDPWTPPSAGPVDVDDERPAADEDTAAAPRHDRDDGDDDVLDAEFTEWFDYDQSPADQDDGTGYDDEEVAYQRYQAEQWAREGEAAQAEREGADETEDATDDEDDDVARTSRIHTGDDGSDADHGHSGHEDSESSESSESSEHDREGSDGRRR